ncbi:M23 family metallopeptidase [Synechococcus sp. BA-120 BA3]|nr:M23 family metallopeptidase [Synechococcus sp. BA-120 BA3]
MDSRFRRFLTALTLPWLLPLSLAPVPLLAMGEPPPRLAEIPLEVPVGDLGRNERLPDLLRSRYRPAPAGAFPVQRAGALGYPLALQPSEQAPFGWRLADSRNAWRMHTGLDLIAPEGTPVFAVLPGTVRLVDEVGGYGLLVVIDHGLGWQSLYAQLLDVAVLPGESLVGGQPIGRVGSSGSATTAHLHFEWRQLRQGRLVAVDPSPLLQPIGTGPSVAGRAPLPPLP